MFMLVSRRCERASLIVTSNKAFSSWGEIFGDNATAAAMIDRLIHHADILSLKGQHVPSPGLDNTIKPGCSPNTPPRGRRAA
jgi:DNA replication protein DnaC